MLECKPGQTYWNLHNGLAVTIEYQQVEILKRFRKMKDRLKKLNQFNFFGTLTAKG